MPIRPSRSRIEPSPQRRVRFGPHRRGDCTKPFAVPVGTVHEASEVPRHERLRAVCLLASGKRGVGSHRIHRALAVTSKAAWFATRRVREPVGSAAADGARGTRDRQAAIAARGAAWPAGDPPPWSPPDPPRSRPAARACPGEAPHSAPRPGRSAHAGRPSCGRHQTSSPCDLFGRVPCGRSSSRTPWRRARRRTPRACRPRPRSPLRLGERTVAVRSREVVHPSREAFEG